MGKREAPNPTRFFRARPLSPGPLGDGHQLGTDLGFGLFVAAGATLGAWLATKTNATFPKPFLNPCSLLLQP